MFTILVYVTFFEGAGGSENRAKEQWFMAATESWFQENPDLLGCEVADFLEVVLQREFDLLVEDGSVEEVGEMLVQYYRQG